MILNIKNKVTQLMEGQSFHGLAVAAIDFKSSRFECFEYNKSNSNHANSTFFDLASLTKPLTLSLAYLLKPEIFTSDMLLLLNHRAGLPAYARLSKEDYKDNIHRYEIMKSETLYSDLGAIRLMQEIEENIEDTLYSLVRPLWDKDILHWKELEGVGTERFLSTGFRAKQEIRGVVNDDNAFVIEEELSSAGLFSTIEALSLTILNMNKKQNLLDSMLDAKKDKKGRFLNGWDTVTDLENTLAGAGCSKSTFGHLGFTGTSIWIDPEKELGHIILTNATQNYWYDRRGLNELRRIVGREIWSV